MTRVINQSTSARQIREYTILVLERSVCNQACHKLLCHFFVYRCHDGLPSQTNLPAQKPGISHPPPSIAQLVEETQNLAGNVLPPCLLVVHDTS